MEPKIKRIKKEISKLYIKIGDLSIEVIPRNTLTAKKIIENLPFKGKAEKWGKEYYFYTNLNLPLETNAKQIISLGEIAYWPKGDAIAIGYGKTPISKENEIRLADKCNIWADTNFNLNKLDNLINPSYIYVE